MLDVYAQDHNPRWYSLALSNAQRALANAKTKQGLYLRGWDGGRAPDAPTDSLKIDAATVSVFAWLAAATPPSPSASGNPSGGGSGYRAGPPRSRRRARPAPARSRPRCR